MKTKLFSYNQLDTFIHRLSGVTKLVCFLLLTFALMLTFDYRVILIVFVFSLVLFKMSKIPLKQLKVVFIYLALFMVLNTILSFLFEPELGVRIFGTRHVVMRFSERYVLTLEQLFYEMIKLMKYIAVIPFGLIFIATTDPSEFASSLNKIKISYRASISVSLTLRYFPDIMRSYRDVSSSLQARGLGLGKEEKFWTRVKNQFTIMIPLIFSSFDKIETIANAMDLRSFGYSKKRTWYTYRPLHRNDYLALLISFVILSISIVMWLVVNKSRFYNPFI